MSKLIEPNYTSVLLAEDDQDDILLFKEAVDGNEIKIKVAEDGIEAIAALSEPPLADIIFLDINMPRMNGLECLRKIRKSYTDLPVIILTTSNDNALIKHVREAGASGFIIKPCNFSKLRSVLQEVLSINWSRLEDCFYLNTKQDTILS